MSDVAAPLAAPLAAPSAAPFAAAPRAVLFDAYGTLFDVYSVGVAAERLFPGDGDRLGVLWRDKQIEYMRLASMSGRARSFHACTSGGLRYAAKRLGLGLDAAAEAELMATYLRLTPFPENRDVLVALKSRGIRAGILSNGDPEMLAPLVAQAGFAELVDPVLSVAGTGRFKTDPATYALGPAAFDLPASEILFVSSNCWDAIGATWHGYTTLWINRYGWPLEELETRPTRIGTSLADVLACFPDATFTSDHGPAS